MALAPDSLLLHYRLVEQIGEGGMGVVWKARDTTLDREVAIKVLPDVFAGDAERLARFEREAKTLAALNHPNLAAIYGLHVARGTRFLAMELVPGEDLSQRLARGPLPQDAALAIALRIAEGLEYAHEHGIVHRDLKPANVKLAPDGAVKILDFGLAKALEPTASGGPVNLSLSPTVTSAGTMAGVILGTAAYMSPEQAAGKEVDRRSDVWAFGVVLYEMLAGRMLFEGETVSHVLAGVLKDDPDWEALGRLAPPPLLELLRRCLRKDPRRRLQSIGDARVLLEEWSAEPARLAARTAAAAEPAPRRVRGALAAWIAVAALAGAAAGAGWQLLRRAPAAPDTAAWYSVALPPGQNLFLQEHPALALSPDGRRQAYVTVSGDSATHIVLRDLDRAEPRVVEGTDDAHMPFFSPDGAWIGYFANAGLWKVPVDGGTPVRLAAVSSSVRGGTWGTDGRIYLADNTQGGLKRISAHGGDPQAFTEPDAERQERTHRWPHALVEGSAVLFTSDMYGSTEYYDDARIEAASIASGERKVLVERSSYAQALPGGILIHARGGSLYAQRFDPQRLATEGEPVLVLQGVATDVSSGAVHFSLSREGSLLYVPGDMSSGSRSEPVWVDRQGNESPAGVEAGRHEQLALSPDGRRLALLSSAGDQSGELWVWVADLERGTMSRLTFAGLAGDPVWAPDGRHIAYSISIPERNAGRVEVDWRRADGIGDEEQLISAEEPVRPTCFSPDGHWLLLDRLKPDGSSDIWMVSLDGERELRPFFESPFDEYMTEISPDGRWLAYISDETGRYEVYVRPFPDADERWQISTGGGMEPRWSADGRELYYRDRRTLMAVAIDTSNGLSAGHPEPLFDGLVAGGNPRTYGVTRDGRFLHLGRVDRGGAPATPMLVRHWDVEVRSKLAAAD